MNRFGAIKQMMRLKRIPFVVVIVALTFGALTPLRASGATIESKKAEAAQLEADIQANGDRIAALGEQYNGAVLAYEDAKKAVSAAQARLVRAHERASALSALVSVRAAALYQGASDPMSALIPSTDIKSVNELGVRTEYGSVATGNDERLIADLSRSQEDLKIERRRLDKRVASAAGKRDYIAAAKQDIEAANAHETELLSQVKGELATLIAQEKARKEAAIKRALEELANQGNGSSSVPASSVGGDNIPNLPAPSARAGAAIAFAEAQLGKPYEYAASGPNTFDCSGLTMRAWGAAGVSMPHYSGAQYAMFPHVPLDQLQPGDLLFWGPGGSEHVAMYIGGGLQIAATHTGDYVRIQSMGSNPVGAARPG
ncbi:MAG: peptidoglycan DL-endopeptidase CwlO [Actinomycetota bacterium]|nr:peptidoglycan DL-endopeptidase CwlO [Actinomycetota bacterium]